MKTTMKIITYPAFALFAFACFALSPTAQAQTPNKTVISYSLAPGANSAAITPVANKPVLVIGVCTTSGWRGVGQATLLHIPSSFIEWTGLESPYYLGSAVITDGYSGAAGTHIVFMDYGHTVDIQVNSADTIRVHNGSGITQTGNVTLVW